MHTVELLEAALALAKHVGYRIRQDWLGGSGGGGCELQGHKYIFLDLALDPNEQLDQVLAALRGDPALVGAAVPEVLSRLLDVRKSA